MGPRADDEDKVIGLNFMLALLERPRD